MNAMPMAPSVESKLLGLAGSRVSARVEAVTPRIAAKVPVLAKTVRSDAFEGLVGLFGHPDLCCSHAISLVVELKVPIWAAALSVLLLLSSFSF